MVSFARARTKSLISRLWPIRNQMITNETSTLDKSKELINKQKEEDKFFLEATKNGGIWLS